MEFMVMEDGPKSWDALKNTSLRGYIDTSFDVLVARFGQPGKGDDYKTDAHWIIAFEDGTIAGIYNYKDGPNYLGVEGTPVKDIREWHIGGVKGADALDLVAEMLNAPIKYRC